MNFLRFTKISTLICQCSYSISNFRQWRKKRIEIPASIYLLFMPKSQQRAPLTADWIA